MDGVVQILKLLGIVCTTGLAVAGLLTEFRDKNRYVTKWGKRALVAIIVSGSLTILVHLLESAAASRAQAREIARLAAEVQRQEQTLEGVHAALLQLERSQASLQGVRVSVTLEFPETSPYISDHHQKFRELYNSYASDVTDGNHPYDSRHPDFSVYKSSDGKSVQSVLLFSTSKDFPDISFTIAAQVRPAGVQAGEGSLDKDGGQPTDLDFALFTGRAEEMRLTYHPSRKTYGLRFVEAPSFAYASGGVNSLLDLPGRAIGLGFIDYVADGGKALQELQLTEVSFVHPLGMTRTVPASAIRRTGEEYPAYSFYGTIIGQGVEPANKSMQRTAFGRR